MIAPEYIQSTTNINFYISTEVWCKSYLYYKNLYNKTISISHPNKPKVVSYLVSNCKLCKKCLIKRQNRNK